MKRAAALKYGDIRMGEEGSFRHFISKEDVKAFARLSGDFNPLHLDKKFACKTLFKGPIVHGMLAASLFSTVIGMHCPGKNAVILSQEIKYLRPVRPDSEVRVSYEVINKTDAVKILIVKTSIHGPDGVLLVEGMNKVKVMR